MTDIDILRQMISPAAKVQTRGIYGKQSITLREPQEPDSKVEIYGIPNDSIIIKMDSFPSPDCFFSGLKSECKRADFAIIARQIGKKRIIFIEMKKSSHSEKEIVLQFKGAECALAYCKSIAEKFYNAGNFLEGYKYRFVAFYHTGSINKKPTRERQGAKHDCPEKMLKIR